MSPSNTNEDHQGSRSPSPASSYHTALEYQPSSASSDSGDSVYYDARQYIWTQQSLLQLIGQSQPSPTQSSKGKEPEISSQDIGQLQPRIESDNTPNGTQFKPQHLPERNGEPLNAFGSRDTSRSPSSGCSELSTTNNLITSPPAPEDQSAQPSVSNPPTADIDDGFIPVENKKRKRRQQARYTASSQTLNATPSCLRGGGGGFGKGKPQSLKEFLSSNNSAPRTIPPQHTPTRHFQQRSVEGTCDTAGSGSTKNTLPTRTYPIGPSNGHTSRNRAFGTGPGNRPFTASSNPTNAVVQGPVSQPFNPQSRVAAVQGHNSMATTGSPSGRGVASPRPKGRGVQNDKKRFNADSPAFQPTPLQPTTNLPTPTNGISSAPRSATISPKAANAAIFTPKIQNTQLVTPSMSIKNGSQEFYPQQEYQEFVPGNYDSQYSSEHNGPVMNYDGYSHGPMNSLTGQTNQMSLNGMFSNEPHQVAGASYYNAGGFSAPLNHHLYFPQGPHPRNLSAYQKLAHEFFIDNKVRETLQKKSDASRQVMQGTSLPHLVGPAHHTLVPLDTGNKKSISPFGYTSWIYKATSKKDGLAYALRRLEGYHASDAAAITTTIKAWQKIDNPNVVNIHEAFTSQNFGDSSLILITDYHPLSKTLDERYFAFRSAQAVPESVLWSYIVQIASALKEIHENGLAARVITLNKVIETSTNRIRLNGCAVLDITQYDVEHSPADLQRQDLTHLGLLILSLGSAVQLSPLTVQSPQIQGALALLGQRHHSNFSELVRWLVTGPSGHGMKEHFNINTLFGYITSQVVGVLNSSLHCEDRLTSTLSRELENGRMFRLMTKLGMINERPEYEGAADWSETGPRYQLKLFRDYVFHQVDGDGRPVIDMAHVVTCLNKLDAGVDEKVLLTTRDEQHVIVASYKELARSVESAWLELQAKPAVGRGYR